MTFLATLLPSGLLELQGGQDLNLQPAVLETAALPIEPPPYELKSSFAASFRPQKGPLGLKKAQWAYEMMADFNYLSPV
jgi:hypothetical protein